MMKGEEFNDRLNKAKGEEIPSKIVGITKKVLKEADFKISCIAP